MNALQSIEAKAKALAAAENITIAAATSKFLSTSEGRSLYSKSLTEPRAPAPASSEPKRFSEDNKSGKALEDDEQRFEETARDRLERRGAYPDSSAIAAEVGRMLSERPDLYSAYIRQSEAARREDAR